ncbi:MAG: DUF1972 domain-containing protein [Bacteroidota bacterium]
MKIGILGTRGIPNRYGGFEQCAEYLAAGLLKKGHDVWVYNAHNHEHALPEWNGVHIIHCYDPEHKLGTAGQFIYDYNCIRDARKRNFDVLLQLGYTSNSIWYRLWPRKCTNVVNMDGLEWKRTKYNKYVQAFLRKAERWAALNGDVLVADSTGIQQYLLDTYRKPSVFIPYGAEIFDDPSAAIPAKYGLKPYEYNLLIARMEPENNVEMIIKGSIASKRDTQLIVIGKTGNDYGKYLVDTYGSNSNIRFLGGIYDAAIINNLRYFSLVYFHGHTVGGTNPSLLEAMGCRTLIAANDNVFNKSVLGADALYFSNSEDIAKIIFNTHDKEQYALQMEHNIEKIRNRYNWGQIVDEYEQVFIDAVKRK